MAVHPKRAERPPQVPDLCMLCQHPIKVYERSWESMRSDEGCLVAANFCSATCARELANPTNRRAILRTVRQRQAVEHDRC